MTQTQQLPLAAAYGGYTAYIFEYHNMKVHEACFHDNPTFSTCFAFWMFEQAEPMVFQGSICQKTMLAWDLQ